MPFSAHASSQGSVAVTVLSGNETNTSESPETPGGSAGGGGGGGGAVGAVALSSSFVIEPQELTLFVVAGSLEEPMITVANTGRSPLTLAISVSGISSFVVPEADRITLGPGEARTVSFTVKAPDSGIYGGRIQFTSGSITRDVVVLVNVRSSYALFDVSLSIPESFKRLGLGRSLKTFISLLQVGPVADVDVTVTYLLKDFNGATLFTETETFRVLKTKSYVKEFATATLPPGDYLAGIEVAYPGGFATSSAHFTLTSRTFDRNTFLLIGVLVASLVVLFYSFRFYRAAQRTRKRGKR